MTDILWIVPEKQGGIWSYSKTLWPEVKRCAQSQGFKCLDPIQDLDQVYSILKEHKPKAIHVQHEFSFFGTKTPILYFFPRWVRHIRENFPETKIVATAHVVMPENYSYPTRGRGWQIPLRALANQFLIKPCRKLWSEDTWKPLDGVIVHSDIQVPLIKKAGNKNVKSIPLSVFNFQSPKKQTVVLDIADDTDIVVIFGFITPEKGQDVAVRAMSVLLSGTSKPVHLVIAGGSRRKADLRYVKQVRNLIQSLGLTRQISITGFLNEAQAEDILSRATLILAPFRDTTGSASLAQALSRGCPILASDHPLNLELGQRVPGSLAYFKSEDPEDCAIQMKRLLESPAERQKLSAAAKVYSEKYSPQRIAEMHVEFYKSLLK